MYQDLYSQDCIIASCLHFVMVGRRKLTIFNGENSDVGGDSEPGRHAGDSASTFRQPHTSRQPGRTLRQMLCVEVWFPLHIQCELSSSGCLRAC